MKSLVVVFLMLGFATSGLAAGDPFAGGIHSAHGGQSYDFNFSLSRLQKAPEWANEKDFPPLSPRIALQQASKQLGQLIPGADKDWLLSEITLKRFGGSRYWVYIVSFLQPADANGLMIHFQIPVLLDGTTIDPVISKVKQQE